MILKVDFALKLRSYYIIETFFMYQMNPKKFSVKLHSQFNYHTLPVAPLNVVYLFHRFFVLSVYLKRKKYHTAKMTFSMGIILQGK